MGREKQQAAANRMSASLINKLEGAYKKSSIITNNSQKEDSHKKACNKILLKSNNLAKAKLSQKNTVSSPKIVISHTNQRKAISERD